MKNYSYKPTDEIVIDLMRENSIGRFRHVLRFVNLLSHMEDDCYSIALNGEWGAGKTFFIKQVKLLLDAYNPFSSLLEETRDAVVQLEQNGFNYPTNYTTVYYDAWSNDNHIDPILSLVYTIIASNQINYDVERKRSIGEAAASIADAITGRNISDVLKSLHGTDRFQTIEETEGVKELVKNLLDALIVEHGDRLIFIVDELDRCKPDYALSLLERIKHFFDDERVTFVFAVNLSQLTCTVKSYYGSNINATRYLDKFFDFYVALPRVNHEQFIHQLGLTGDNVFDEVCIETAKYYGFSLRETERYVRLYRIVQKELTMRTTGFPELDGNAFAAWYFVPVMLGMQMSDATEYARFISGKDCGALLEILVSSDIRMKRKWLCNSNEEFDTDRRVFIDSNGNTVTLNERLKEVYSAIFIPSRRAVYGDIHVGGLCFTERTRNVIEEVVSLLSENSDYGFQ